MGVDSKLLVQECLQGNSKAQFRIYSLYAPYMFTVAKRILHRDDWAEDAMQEGFISAFRSLHTYRFESDFKYWLKRIVSNKAIDHLKKNQKLTLVDDFSSYTLENDEEEQLENSENMIKRLLATIEQLPENYRLIVELFYIQEYSHQEIADKLDISSENSRVLLNRAKNKLIKMVKDK